MSSLKSEIRVSSVTERLISLIKELSEVQQRALLEGLNLGPANETRQHPRVPSSTLVDFVTEGRAYREFTRNISRGGLFIETPKPFNVGQDITMTFTFPDSGRPLKMSGKIVRVEDDGIGIHLQTTNH